MVVSLNLSQGFLQVTGCKGMRANLFDDSKLAIDMNVSMNGSPFLFVSTMMYCPGYNLPLTQSAGTGSSTHWMDGRMNGWKSDRPSKAKIHHFGKMECIHAHCTSNMCLCEGPMGVAKFFYNR